MFIDADVNGEITAVYPDDWDFVHMPRDYKIECTKEEFEALKAQCDSLHRIILKDGRLQIRQPTEIETIKNQYYGLKGNLHDSDEKTMEFLEGVISAQEYEAYRLKRSELRQEIKEIENKYGGYL